MKPHLLFVLAAAVLLSLIPDVVLAQSTSTSSTGCGAFGTAFNGMIQGTNAFSTFFYGPFFKVGCLAAFAIAGVVLPESLVASRTGTRWSIGTVAVARSVSAFHASTRAS